jgi:hypothetical protein
MYVYNMKNEITIDDVINTLQECLEYTYKLKFEGENEYQDLGSLIDSIRDSIKELQNN